MICVILFWYFRQKRVYILYLDKYKTCTIDSLITFHKNDNANEDEILYGGSLILLMSNKSGRGVAS